MSKIETLKCGIRRYDGPAGIGFGVLEMVQDVNNYIGTIERHSVAGTMPLTAPSHAPQTCKNWSGKCRICRHDVPADARFGVLVILQDANDHLGTIVRHSAAGTAIKTACLVKLK